MERAAVAAGFHPAILRALIEPFMPQPNSNSQAKPLTELQTRILYAASEGNGREVARLLGVSGDANFFDEAGETPLLRSIGAPEPHDDGRAVQLTAFEVLLPRSDLSARNIAGADALMFAAHVADLSAIRSLLPRSNLIHRARNGYSALHFAVESGNMEAAQILAPLFPCDDRDWRGQTPLSMSISDRTRSTFDLLLPLSNPFIADNEGKTPLMSATDVSSPHFFERLLPVSDVNQTDAKGRTVLHVAAKNNAAWALERLLPLCDANALTHSGQNALMVAASFGSLEAAQALFAATDKRHADHEGNDALILAFKSLGDARTTRETVEKLAALLASSANPAARNAQGEHALSLALAAGMGAAFSSFFARANDAEFEALARSALFSSVGPAASARFESYLLNQETRATRSSASTAATILGVAATGSDTPTPGATAAPALPGPTKRARSL